MLNTIIAPNIKRIIKERCLKQAAIAEKAGYSTNAFSAMMNGRKMIKDVDVIRIANALDVDANELFKKGDD